MQTFADLDVVYVVTLAVTCAGAIALVAGIHYVSGLAPDVVRERLQRALGASGSAASDRSGLARDKRGRWEGVLEPIARIARPGNARELDRLRGRLAQAGLRSDRALVHYLGAKVVLAAALGIAFLIVEQVWPVPALYAALCTIASTAVGFYAPSLWLISRINERQREINHSLPNALDLLVTCVEAGLGLEAAIQRVASELSLGAPLLANELEQTELEMRAGIGRGEAFRRMADRTGVEELRNLSAIIIQTQIFGTSIAKSLRIQADAIRVRRMQLAEERAAAASVKMTIPLILCIAPTLFAVLLGPAVVKIVRELLPTLHGGH